MEQNGLAQNELAFAQIYLLIIFTSFRKNPKTN